ncbi:MAG: metal ABC transporter permease, partial [Alphaproteobacteria bacterium]|nr:metal ABC transporter permease [Alphaproteobacteria bacterium]
MITDFFTRALIAGVCVALVAGPAGCFIVWRRMAYFGDTMAHSALLGVALGLLLGVDPVLGVLAVSIVLALILAGMAANRTLASDTVLGILSH